MPRRQYRADDYSLPMAIAQDTWRGAFGEAKILRGVPPPQVRTFQSDLFWLLDNVLKAGECMDLTRGHDSVKQTVSQYRKTRQVPLGVLKVRQVAAGKTRIWKLTAGYEKPDAATTP